ncbi:Nucleotide-binding universal stress protein, UspA family [Thermodesulfobium acidiphilum]|uniref:Nucleotide-binding universal stress protein, UspA family n=1 Tax=Thermodesulfobium acidiphilum TaxID=1794699 RepID=A0A2R4W0K0_THEAF|nr:universal stress protein [Thermodesulfobium acidiphilum]AWB10331.1 Nucleotide-binding universal stress protein, UspA family [Thermodesulfobium acidiphilum]
MKILVGVNDSNDSQDVARWAIKFASQDKNGEVILVFVEKRMPFISYEDITDEQLMALAQLDGEIIFEKCLKGLDTKGVIIHEKIVLGDPSTEILKIAKEEKVDFIALGTRALSPVCKMFMCSVSERVIKKSTIPVIINRFPFESEKILQTANT